MLKTFLTTTAATALIATGAIAQSPPAATPDNESEIIERRPAAEADTETAPDTAETDETAPAEAPETAGSEPAPGAAATAAGDASESEPALADDPEPAETEPELADDPESAPLDTADEAEPAETDVAEPEPAEPDAGDDPAAEPDDAEAPILEEAETAEEPAPALDLAGASLDELLGSDVIGMDDEQIATVDDIVTAPEGDVQSVLVSFGGFLGFGQTVVALSPEEVEVARNDDDEPYLRTALSQDDLRDRPAHEE